MSKNIPTQAEQKTPIPLKLDRAVFSEILNEVIPSEKIGWTSEDHYDLVKRLLADLKDEEGKSPTIPAPLQNILKLIFKPTEDVEKDVLRQAFADAGYVLDTETEGIFVMMFSAPQFADFLAKTKNPTTTKSYIKKSSKRGRKKSTFESLIAATAPATGVTEVEPKE